MFGSYRTVLTSTACILTLAVIVSPGISRPIDASNANEFAVSAEMQRMLTANQKELISLKEMIQTLIRDQCSEKELKAMGEPVIYYADAPETPAQGQKELASDIRKGLIPFKVALRKMEPGGQTKALILVTRAQIVSANEITPGIDVKPQVDEVGTTPSNAINTVRVKKGPYTGLVVDARGLGLCRSMSPRIVSEFAAVVWELGIRDIKVFNANTYYGWFENMDDKQKDALLERGIVSYAKDINESCVKARCGENPLVIKGIRKAHSAEDWVVVSPEDGKEIESAERDCDLKKGFKVSILVDK